MSEAYPAGTEESDEGSFSAACPASLDESYGGGVFGEFVEGFVVAFLFKLGSFLGVACDEEGAFFLSC